MEDGKHSVEWSNALDCSVMTLISFVCLYINQSYILCLNINISSAVARKYNFSTSADDITIAETTADKRHEYTQDDAGSGYGEIRERFTSPELLPPMGTRSKLLDYLERQDCYKRRKVIDIPEFYVGKLTVT